MPVTMVRRNGVELGELTKEQRADALGLLAAILSKEGYKKVIDVRFDPKSNHPLKGGDRNAVRAAFAERADLKGVDRIRITTDKGIFEFDPPFPNH